ncbi:protein of unknown function [Chryseobacterium sp. JV274]|nr:protein of unknown function [Chryseobacterium sp. JV274]
MQRFDIIISASYDKYLINEMFSV